MFCTSCGSHLKDGAKFCVQCGAPTGAAPATPPAPAAPPAPPAPAASQRPWRVSSVLLPAVIIIAAGAAALYWLYLRPATLMVGEWHSEKTSPAQQIVSLKIDRADAIGNLSGSLQTLAGSGTISGRAFGHRISIEAIVQPTAQPTKNVHFDGMLNGDKIDGTMTESGPAPTAAASPVPISLVRVASANVAVGAAAATVNPNAAPAAKPSPPKPHASHGARIAHAMRATPKPVVVGRQVVVVVKTVTAPPKAEAPHTTAPEHISREPVPTPHSRSAASSATMVADRPVLQKWACALAGVGLSGDQQTRIQALITQYDQQYPVGTRMNRAALRSLKQQILGMLSADQAAEFQQGLTGGSCQPLNQ